MENRRLLFPKPTTHHAVAGSRFRSTGAPKMPGNSSNQGHYTPPAVVKRKFPLVSFVVKQPTTRTALWREADFQAPFLCTQWVLQGVCGPSFLRPAAPCTNSCLAWIHRPPCNCKQGKVNSRFTPVQFRSAIKFLDAPGGEVQNPGSGWNIESQTLGSGTLCMFEPWVQTLSPLKW